MGDLLLRKKGDIEFFVCPDWENEVAHGFTGKTLDFTSDFAASKRSFCTTFECEDLILPNQSHSTVIVDLRASASSMDGDAIVFSRRQGGRVAYGIRTADCLPVLIRCNDTFAVVHAGWRGLADGILEKSIRCLMAGGNGIEVVIGPAAGDTVYQIGDEVIDRFFRSPPVVRLSGQKKCLALEETAVQYILSVAPSASIKRARISTMLDERFHSYRRDGAKSGRNLAFIIP